MKQNFAITLVIGSLFALWLFNTGRLSAFKTFLLTTPAKPTLPKSAAQAAGGASQQQIAACAESASAGIPDASCLAVLADPGGAVGAVVSALSFGVIKL